MQQAGGGAHAWSPEEQTFSTPSPRSLSPCMSDRSRLIKTGGLILVCKSMAGLGEGSACHGEAGDEVSPINEGESG